MIHSNDAMFSAGGFMPHGMCYLWRPDMLALHIGSDALIALAYFSISFTLLYFVRKSRRLQFNWMFVCFALFIVACGATHLSEIWVIWHPDYWASGMIKAVTALASVSTAILLVRLVPAALALPSAEEMRRANAQLADEILERRRTEQALLMVNRRLIQEAARARLAAIVESSDDAIISKSADGTITSWNRGAQHIFGYADSEAVGRPMTLLFPPDLVGEEIENLARITRGERIDNFETKGVRKDGGSVDVSVTISPIRDGDGAIIGTSTIARDITDRRLAGRRLAEQLARLQLLNTITRAIGERQDLPSIHQIVIRSLEDHLPVEFGCLLSRDEPDSLVVAQVGLKHPRLAADLGLIERATAEVGESGLSRCVEGRFHYEPDSSAVPSPFSQRFAAHGLKSLVGAPLRIHNKVVGVLVVARRDADGFSSGEFEFLAQLADHVALATQQSQLYAALEVAYSDLKTTQEAVIRQEKLRVLGQIATGIAHDINNALTPAAVYVELMLERNLGTSGEFKDYLEITRRAIEGIAQTIARMKDFDSFRDALESRLPVQLNEAVGRVIDLTRARWTAMAQATGVVIRVETALEPGLPVLLGDDGEIRDALTNLVLNAVDAMPHGGLLTLRTCTVGAGRIQVEVMDTGMGMNEEARARCLDLFFTTKGERGTGLGLSMVEGAVQRHGGELQIDSVYGVGTTVRLIFPAGRPPLAAAATATPQPQRSLRILAIDDDPLILQSLAIVLTREGHAVDTADGGQRGIDAFREADAGGRPFDVVITDLGMPHVDGRKVGTAIKAMRPGTPVILLTGWGHRFLEDDTTAQYVDRVVAKPPKLAELRGALAELTG